MGVSCFWDSNCGSTVKGPRDALGADVTLESLTGANTVLEVFFRLECCLVFFNKDELLMSLAVSCAKLGDTGFALELEATIFFNAATFSVCLYQQKLHMSPEGSCCPLQLVLL